jgi:hypothetical protein
MLTKLEIEAGKAALQLYRDNLHAAFRTVPRPEQTEALCRYAQWLEDQVEYLGLEIIGLKDEAKRLCAIIDEQEDQIVDLSDELDRAYNQEGDRG